MNCREWVYFDCYLDIVEIRKHFNFPDFVRDHYHRGTHDGQELGLVCSRCNDAIVGSYEACQDKLTFQG